LKRFIFAAIFLSIIQSAPADEGMWRLDQLDQLNLKADGLQIDVSSIYNPDGPDLTDAIVNLGGASAELVSPDGLLLTNHHVAFGAVQRVSTRGIDYLTEGFLAKTREDEIPAPGYTARILREMRDVTNEVLDGTTGISDPLKLQHAVQRKIKEMREALEKESSDVDVTIASMYDGLQYILFRYQRFDDVRMVFIPPQAIGNYGGEIDNWMWPRHTGDFSFLRIYMAPDGHGAKYAKENIPYKTDTWLKVATAPLKDGDFTFIMGYPGRTTRYKTSYAVDYYEKYYYPRVVEKYTRALTMLDSLAKISPQLAIKTAGTGKGLANTMKNNQGNLDGMKKYQLADQKLRFEEKLQAFISSDKKLSKAYASLFRNIEQAYQDDIAGFERRAVLNNLNNLAGLLVSVANSVYRTVSERSKPEGERDPSFSESDTRRFSQRLMTRYTNFDVEIDSRMLRHILQDASLLAADQRIKGLEYIFRDFTSIDDFIHKAFATTKLNDAEFAKSLYTKSKAEIDEIDDPFIILAKNLYAEMDEQRKSENVKDAQLSDLHRNYIQLLKLFQKTPLYADANSTLRFTYGYVKGYKPQDAVWFKPFTTFKGVIEKDQGLVPFNVPEKLKDIYKTKDFGRWVDPGFHEVPVAFTHSCDITGGNSGSPVLNARGELIGIAFDGNYEWLTCNWQYNDDLQRTISVDIRYVLFITEKFAGATHLLMEMGIN